MSNTKDTPCLNCGASWYIHQAGTGLCPANGMEESDPYKPQCWSWTTFKSEDELGSLKLELQKQKEINAELVKGLEYIKKTLGALCMSQDTPEGRAYNEAESLIKKSNEI